jgi:hypothetical protein
MKRFINAGPAAPPLRLVVPLSLVLSLVVFGTRSPQGAALAAVAPGGLACGSWTVVPSSNAESGSALTGVAAVSQGDAWTVGSSSDGSVYHTLAEHWNGSGWSVASTPNMGTRTNSLSAVAAASKNDVWAVGFYDDGTTFRTLAEHWNGSSWSVVTTPNVGAGQNILTSVAVISGTDVWAVGYRQESPNSPRLTLAEHWNGSAWSVKSTPNVGTDENFLWSVTARSASDVWAVGAYSVPWFQTLTEHWDGAAWKVVASPNLGDGNNVLYSAVRVGSRAVTAVGTWLNGDVTDTLAQHWNGTAWKVVTSPSPAGYINWLSGVAAAGKDDVWAVGWRSDVPFGVQHTLAEHWNGTSWRVARTPNKGTEDNQLAMVARVPGTASFWAVGHYERNFIDRTLILFRC